MTILQPRPGGHMCRFEKLFYRASFLVVAGSVGLGLATRMPVESTQRSIDHLGQLIASAKAQAAPTSPTQSDALPQPVIFTPFPARASFETGDSWIADGRRFRLYGVQSCLRGTRFSNASGAKVDCGEAAIAILASLVQEAKAQCATAFRVDAFNEVVACHITIGANRYDLGTYLTLTGWAFAAVAARGEPVHLPYFVNEVSARKNKLGFWQFPDVPHPTKVLAAARRTP